MMSWGWTKRVVEERQAAETAALTDTFLEMDATLSRVQVEVDDYRLYTGKRDLDITWGTVRSRCDDAIAAYMALVGPESTPTAPAVQNCAVMLQGAIVALRDFEDGNSRFLSEGINAKLDAAAREANEARRAREVQAEIARQAAEMPEKARVALASVDTRIQAARNRLENVGPARSQLVRDYPAGCWDDLSGCEEKARELIWRAGDKLGMARISSDPERKLECARLARIDLAEADTLTDAVPDRLRELREIAADPKARADKVRFKLHDAQMYAVDHHKVDEWGSVLDFQLQRIGKLEDTLHCTHPDYWAYQNGLDEVMDSIQAAVAKMRG